ncbi:MAG: alpha-glucuronidase [Bacteroidaceae bacterium]|nr:alpha-glucuronidase [Bacteroidaceae bacterium]
MNPLHLPIKRTIALAAMTCCLLVNSFADDGSGLWLGKANGNSTKISVATKTTATIEIAKKELSAAWTGGNVSLQQKKVKDMKRDAYRIEIKNGDVSITSPSDIGLLYGSYRLLQLQTMGKANESAVINESPFHDIRLLNHWDNLDGNSERGYAGKSIFWNVQGFPESLGNNDVASIKNCPLNNDTYARACASVGINGAVLNNVNASPKMLTSEVLQMVKKYADVLRPYGIKTYLAVNFASPAVIGGLPTADPADKAVQRWWKDKAKEIYALVPDFGGFLVKANSEGQPGPKDYDRTHTDGANLLAAAIRPYGGIVMWRAFINNPTDPDRAKQARLEFEDLDGQFLDNVIIQVKNGPIDFQPREPFNALYDALKETAEMPEFQITQEYLGQANHLAYLGTMWEEFFDEVKQYANYKRNQLRSRYNAIAGVANTGTDANFTGHPLAQSNWYAFGRLAWNPDLTAEEIANEWTMLTYPTLDAEQHATLVSMLMRSREAVVDYEMPIGLAHQFGNSHYAPGVWDNRPIRRDWLPVFYNQADENGIGFDRTKATGTDNTSQYNPAYGDMMEKLETCPDKYLLWFHHVPWTHRCQTGRTVWEELCYRYQNGVNEARQMQRQWNSLEGAIDAELFSDIQVRLMTQTRDAEWWKDGCLLYFQSLCKMPMPDYVDPPVHTLEECKNNKVHVGLYRSPSREELNRER